MRLLAVAGELSGDVHGGNLLAGLRARLPGLRVSGIGGPRMIAAGLESLFPLSGLVVHGLLEVLGHLPRLFRILWALERTLDSDPPDALLLIDYPGFNLKLARAAKRRGIPVYYYCSPQIWAWRGGRLRTIAEVVDLMIVLFPFEAQLYREAGVEAVFLGHPLVGVEAGKAEVEALEARLDANDRDVKDGDVKGGDAKGGDVNDSDAMDSRALVAMMPGSRPSELRRNLGVLLEAARQIEETGFRCRFVIPAAPSLDPAEVDALVRASGARVTVATDSFLPLLKLADLAVVASGTATLQTAMAGVPFLVVYRVAPLTFWIARRFAYMRHISIVNILAGREIVPELLQGDFTPEKVRGAFLDLAGDQGRQQQMRAALASVTGQLGEPGAYERAADLLAEKLSGQPAPAPPFVVSQRD